MSATVVRDILDTDAYVRARVQLTHDFKGRPRRMLVEFNAAAGVFRPFELNHYGRLAPRDFERASGLANISQEYVLPPGVAAQQVELYAKLQFQRRAEGLISAAECRRRLNGVADLLLRDNPALRDLPVERGQSRGLFDFIVGVTTGFNIRDLQFYLALPPGKAAAARELPGYDALRRRVELREGHLTWVPSPDTLREIERQRARRSAAAPGAIA